MSAFDAIIFDCDGVIVDSELLSCECLALLFTERGMSMTIDFVYREFLGRSFANVEAYYERVVGKNFPAEFRNEYRARLLERFRVALKPMPGAAALLSGLRLPFCLASSSDKERLRVTLAATHLASYFDGRVFDVTMVANGKPAPDLFLFAAAALGVDPRGCLVLEDTVPGVAAGKAAGMTVWGFVGGTHFAGRDGRSQLVSAGADRVVGSMSEVAMALELSEVDG